MKTLTQFLTDIFPDKDLREYVLKYIASSYYGTPSNKLHIFVGEGSNGKSCLGKLIQLTFDDTASTEQDEILYNSRCKFNMPKYIVDRTTKKIVQYNAVDSDNRLFESHKLNTLLNDPTRTFSMTYICNEIPNSDSPSLADNFVTIPFITKFTSAENIYSQLPSWIDEFKKILRVYASKYDEEGLEPTYMSKLLLNSYKKRK